MEKENKPQIFTKHNSMTELPSFSLKFSLNWSISIKREISNSIAFIVMNSYRSNMIQPAITTMSSGKPI
jgi:hypothetical protein